MATIKDVAQMAQVSAMTVSRVLNGKGYVSEEKRQKVLSCVEKLNYRPNQLARSLVLSKSSTVGILLSHIENPVYGQYVSSMAAYFRKRGMDIILYCADSYATAFSGIQTLLDKQVDGVIILPLESYEEADRWGNTDAFLKNMSGLLNRQQRPFVVIGDNEYTPHDNWVREDYRGGAELAVDCLVRAGHRRIGNVCWGDAPSGLWKERDDGFHAAMRRHGLEVNESWRCAVGDDDVGRAREATLKMLYQTKELPSAMFCYNDAFAVGAIQALREKGLRVPEDISIVGHDGNLYSRCTAPHLTTVSIRARETGRAAAKMLLDILRRRISDKDNHLLIPPELVAGGTVLFCEEGSKQIGRWES